MNLGYFISKRIRTGQQGGFSSTTHKIAVASIAIGLGAAIVSFLIMEGFQNTVKNKIYSFSSHLLITRFTMNNSLEEQPFFYNIDLYHNYPKYGYIDHVQEYAHKAGLIKTDDEVFGVVFKGVGKSFGLNTFKQNLVEGEFIHLPDSGYAQEVVISRAIADKIKANVGDDVIVHFFQNPPRFRKLKVVGMYETNLSDYYDSRVIIGDIRMIGRLNDWVDSVAGGLEVFVKDQKDIDKAYETIGEDMDYDLYIEKVSDKYIQVFEWLGLISRQVKILLGVILIVVCVNMISVVLILVMERTQMIGALKAMGAKDRLIRSVFIYNGINLISRGLIYGNVIGLGLCYLQYEFRLVKLNPHDYYMSFVPISWDWSMVLLLNLLVFAVVVFVLMFPTALVARINPIKAIKFD